MSLSVKDRGRTVATLRWIHVRLMETLAAWTPTTPEMEVKLLFGSHIWDVAQHADLLGQRTQELRLPLQHSLVPAPEFVALLDDARGQAATLDRVSLFGDAILPGLARRFAAYLAATDTLLDAPTVRILKRLADDQARMIDEIAELRRDLVLPAEPTAVARRFAAAEASIDLMLADVVA